MFLHGLISMGVLAMMSNTVFASGSDNVGASGSLSTLDGGLQGTVTVQDPKTLVVSNYKLEDGSAPALYWWGSTSNDLKSGFRISQEQVKSTSDGGNLQIALDAGKTSSDFSTVGLWCERFGVNYGQATLQANSASGASVASGSASNSVSSSAPSASTTSSPSTSQTSGATNHATSVHWTVVASIIGLVFVLSG